MFVHLSISTCLYVVVVCEVGEDITPVLRERCLMLCNHQSTGDVPLLMHTMYPHAGLANNVMWIMDILFKYSNFGFVSQVHGDFFIQQVCYITSTALSTDCKLCIIAFRMLRNKKRRRISYPCKIPVCLAINHKLFNLIQNRKMGNINSRCDQLVLTTTVSRFSTSLVVRD